MNLLNEVLSSSNLNRAYQHVLRKKGGCGVDGMTVYELHDYLKEHKDEIIEQIRTRTYVPQPILRVEIPKANGGKRKLGIPTVVDRVIQQAITQVLVPIYEQQFSNYSYGYRPNRSCEKAIIKGLEFMNDGYDWIIEIDLERFFDTVNHDRMMQLLSRTIGDGDILSLIRKYMEAPIKENETQMEPKQGTPQGGNLSPLLSNVMLNELDKEIEGRGLNFVRYADDMQVYVKSRRAADRVLISITKFIEKKLGLIVNGTKSRVAKPEETKFLGFGFYNDDKDKKYKPVPHKYSIQTLQKKLKRLTTRKWSVSLEYRIKKLNEVIRGWINHYRIANMKSAMAKVDQKLRARIRVIIWKQWKVCKKQIESLVKLGIDKEQAKGITYCRRGYQFIAHSWILQRAISNNRLKSKGLVFALDHYLKVNTAI